MQVVRFLLIGVVAASSVGCFSGSDNPRAVHASKDQLVGTYRSDSDVIELQADGKYHQYPSEQKSTINTGNWMIEDSLSRDTSVILNDALLDWKTAKRGELKLDAYKRDGKISLARNATADWYYTKSD